MSLRTPLSVTPHLYMGDSTGRPLDMGTVYFGEQDKDPEFYPINLFSDDALTLPLAQPVHTKGGYLYDKGDMVEPHAKELIYSVKVLDSYGRKVFYKGAMMRNSWNDDVIEQINAAIVASTELARQVATDITNDAINNTAVEGGVLADTFVTVTASSVGSVARSQRDKNAESLSVLDFGADPTGVNDSTAAFNNCLLATDVMYVPKGTYRINHIELKNGQSLLTDGFKTIIQQNPEQGEGSRLIRVRGSNIKVGTLTVRGNIATDVNEQNHGVAVESTSATGVLRDITIGDIHGENIRGDVVFTEGRDNVDILNVTIGNVTGDNIYRNVCSIVTGKNITIGDVTGTRVGLFAFDAESNAYSPPIDNIRVGNIKGRSAGVIGTIPESRVGHVYIASIDLDPAHSAQSVPPYTGNIVSKNAFELRNVEFTHVGNAKIVNALGNAIKTITNSGELGSEHLVIDDLYMENCGRETGIYVDHPLGYIHVKKAIVKDTLAVTSIFSSLSKGGLIENISADISENTALVNASKDVVLSNLKLVSNSGSILQGSSGGGIINSVCQAHTFFNYTTNSMVKNCILTAVNIVAGGDDNHKAHKITNSSLNGEYFGDGFYLRSYKQALRFGGYYVWVDVTGTLRIAGTIPTGDLSGKALAFEAPTP